ncbi:MAG: hypothetical protein ACRDRH_10805 [Pseudonocardia sp.]
MSTDNTTDRLLTDARKKSARSESTAMGIAALVVGVLALLASPISIAGWILGATALGLGFVASRRPVSTKQGTIAMVLGVVAILVGIFFFTLNIAMY